jgi:hypothetical protein
VHEKLSSAIVDLQLYEVGDRDKVELAHEFLSGKHVELSPILEGAGESLRCPCKDSTRYRLPRTAARGFTETSNCDMNVSARFCIRQTLKVEVWPSYGGKVECPKETHEGIDKQRAAPRPQVAVIITEAPFDRRHNTSVNDAGVQGCHLGDECADTKHHAVAKAIHLLPRIRFWNSRHRIGARTNLAERGN